MRKPTRFTVPYSEITKHPGGIKGRQQAIKAIEEVKRPKHTAKEELQGYGKGWTYSYFSEGGLRHELSKCCNASVTETKGGLIFKVCSKCGRKVKERTFG